MRLFFVSVKTPTTIYSIHDVGMAHCDGRASGEELFNGSNEGFRSLNRIELSDLRRLQRHWVEHRPV